MVPQEADTEIQTVGHSIGQLMNISLTSQLHGKGGGRRKEGVRKKGRSYSRLKNHAVKCNDKWTLLEFYFKQ